MEKQVEYLSNITPEEKKAIGWYTSDDTGGINYYLQNAKGEIYNTDNINRKYLFYGTKLDSFDKMVERRKKHNYYNREQIENNMKGVLNGVLNLDKLFINIPPLETSMIVYSGQNINRSSYGYLSTSIFKSMAEEYVPGKNGNLLIITLPIGSKVLPIYKLSEHSGEMEVLLNRNCKFTETSTETSQYGMIIKNLTLII